MLFYEDHLACLNHQERKAVVNAFIKATLQAIPVARKNSMNGNVFPNYVLCVIREKGHPVQLVNAFEEPVFSKNGIVRKSIELLEKEYEGLKNTWGLEEVTEIKMPEKKLSEFLAEVEKHVPAPDKKIRRFWYCACRDLCNPGAMTASSTAAKPRFSRPKARLRGCAARLWDSPEDRRMKKHFWKDSQKLSSLVSLSH